MTKVKAKQTKGELKREVISADAFITPQGVEKPAVYFDPEVNKDITTHSMLKTFRRCPKQAEYKYIERLKPKVLGKPLRRGTWLHALLEAFYKGEDWKAVHKEYCRQFKMLFDEERDALGDLPNEVYRLFKAYLWHYKRDDWKVLDVEFTLEAEFPDGTLYRGKSDMLIENQFGIWIVDHKSHRTLPDMNYRINDAQSALYIWAAQKNGIPVMGHIWNYLRTKAPTIPQQLKGGGLSRRRIETDYLTMRQALKDYAIDPSDRSVAPVLKALKEMQYHPNKPQMSPFFRRDVLEKTPQMIERVIQEAYHSSLRMHNYPWDAPEIVERSPDMSCRFSCSYTDLCSADLQGLNRGVIIRQRYTVGDPLDYYRDQDSKTEKQGRE